MHIELKQLSVGFEMAEYQMMQEIVDGENGFSNPAYNMSYLGYKDWLLTENNRASGRELPSGWVIYTTYVLYVDGTPVGYGRVRHASPLYLEDNGCGPIGYGIASSQRGKGYGKVLLSLLLKKCRDLGYKTICLYPLKSNVASISAMIACGGEIVGDYGQETFFHEHANVDVADFSNTAPQHIIQFQLNT